MVITYEGAEFFKVQYGDVTLAFNPISKSSKLKGGRFGADIVLVSANHPDFNGVDAVTFGEKKPFVISGPGEYEYKEVLVHGLPAMTKYGGEERSNTVYLISLEGINLCFLGALTSKDLPKDVVEAIEEVDVLFVPIGGLPAAQHSAQAGDGVLSATEAYELAVSLEPKLIIPMHFGSVGTKNALETFMKEGGGEKGAEKLDKLTLKKKDLEGKEGDIVLLKPSN
ncbi:MAG TPA: MBL fold metallo-hydrolase [Candidatus Paceibacterota bacterium]